jgi:ubiquinone/menaquinone biosynthesis C-methylase UbiE
MIEHGNISLSYKFTKPFLRNNLKILDIGCNYGSLIHRFYQDNLHNVYGIDIGLDRLSEGITTYQELKHRLICYNGSRLPFADQSFEVILMFDVLEHIPNIEDYLSNQVYRVLDSNGYLILQTPNKFTNIPWEVLKSRSLNYQKYHCSLQSFWSLKRILKRSQFRNIEFFRMPIANQRNIDKVGKILGTPGVWLLKFFDHLPLWAQTNFWCVCRK